jgi:hypothetical protein
MIMAPGLDPDTDRLIVEPLSEETFAAALLGELPRRAEGLRLMARARAPGAALRGVFERRPTVDWGDTGLVGWTYLVMSEDPQRDQIAAILRPLAEHRGMPDPDRPLLFSGEPPEEWLNWMLEHYSSIESIPPHYVLIVAGPDQVPFHFQAMLDSAASVGRVAFENLDDLAAYVEKVLRLERAQASRLRREALIFAPDRGHPDPTYYSRRYMADPIERYIEGLAVPVTGLVGEHATREGLLDALTATHPALVFIAAHGARPLRAPLEEQRRINGAVVCEGGALLTAADLPAATACAEGSIVFQFACFSAGTPAESDYAHWLGQDRLNADSDFIAALPLRLLANPRGPVAIVGHVDLAWLHAFDDPDAPDLAQAQHPRLDPFIQAVETVLAPQPVGLALQPMNKRYDVGNSYLATAFDRQKRGRLPDRPDIYRKLVSAFITRSDAQNYLLMGDPAVYPRMSAD